MRSAVYLDTRVSLFRHHFWNDRQYAELIVAPDAEIAQRLSKRGLPELAMGYQKEATGELVTELATALPTDSLETRLVRQLLAETRILIRPLAGDARQFLRYWISRFEISNVKTLIRAKLAGERPADLATRLVDMGPFTRLDAEHLMHAEDATELLRRLEQSPYAEIVRHARQAFEESRDPFLLDATLDRSYHEGLAQRAHQPAIDAATAELVADLIDRTNLIWLLRYRFNYGLPPAQVFYLLASGGHRLRTERLRDLVARPDLAAVLAGLPLAMGKSLANATDLAEVAARLELEGARQAEKVISAGAAPLARAFAYLILRERNLRKLRAILRGRHLRLPVNAISQAIGQEVSKTMTWTMTPAMALPGDGAQENSLHRTQG